MTLIKLREPQRISPVNNPLPVIYKSTHGGDAGFRYKYDLIRDGYLENSMFIYPDINEYGLAEYSMIISDLINKNPIYNITGMTQLGLTSFNYQVTEYLGNVSGGTAQGADDFYTFKGVTQYGDTWDYTDYEIVTGQTNKFLSKREYRVYSSDTYSTINALWTPDSSFDKMIINVFYGAPLNYGKSYFYNITTTGLDDYDLISLPIGPKNIDEMISGGLIRENIIGMPLQTTSIFNEYTVNYSFFLQKSETKVSEEIYIQYDKNCYKFTPIQFLYLGELGTYETFEATFADEKSYETKWSEVRSKYYNVNEYTDGLTEVKYDYQVGDRGRKVVNKRTTETHVSHTGWLNDKQSNDLMELFTSTDVYVIKDGLIYPVIITNSKYEMKKKQIHKLYKYEIEYEMAYEKLSNA